MDMTTNRVAPVGNQHELGSTSVSCIKTAARAGDMLAQYQLAFMYRKGALVKLDMVKAIKYYKLAAKQGHLTSQISLGLIYKNGHGIVQDHVQANLYFQMGALQNDQRAEYHLALAYYYGTGVVQDFGISAKYFELAAVQGCAHSQENLGCMYYWGTGIQKSEFDALRYFKMAAAQGSINAQYYLGALYKNGGEIVKNDFESFKYFKLAADQGHVEALYNLAIMYENSQGTLVNYAEAFKLYKMAAQQGHAKAQYCLGTIYDIGIGMQPNHKKALKYYYKAAQNGIAAAYTNLGMMYGNGEGVERNLSCARVYFEQAALQGHSMARYYLDALACETAVGAQWMATKTSIQNLYLDLKIQIMERHKQANALAPSMEGEETHFCYGGAKGNHLFQELSRTVAIPQLLAFLKEIPAAFVDSSALSLQEKAQQFLPIFHAFLTLAGEERRFIAQSTNSENAEKFGAFLQKSLTAAGRRETCRYIHDPVAGLKAWHQLVIAHIKDLFLQLCAKSPHGQIGLNAGKHLLNDRLGGSFTFIIQNVEDMKYDSQYFLFLGDVNLEDHELGNLNSSFYCWKTFPGHIDSSASERGFRYLLSQNEIDVWQPQDLQCVHVAAHQPYSNMMEPLLSAILWDSNQTHLERLKADLGQFYWHFVHSSTFCRGQAAMGDWIVRAVFALHHLTPFAWPTLWQNPHAGSDQQALTLSKNHFVSCFIRDISISHCD